MPGYVSLSGWTYMCNVCCYVVCSVISYEIILCFVCAISILRYCADCVMDVYGIASGVCMILCSVVFVFVCVFCVELAVLWGGRELLLLCDYVVC